MPKGFVKVRVARFKAPVVFIALVQVPDALSIGVVALISGAVPDDARLQRWVLLLRRHAAEVAQQSEFSKVSDVSGVPILHVDIPNALSVTSLQENYRSC